MSLQVAKEELNSLTAEQAKIYKTEDISEEIISNFHRQFLKSTWYSSVPIKLKCTADGDETLYIVNANFHFLIYTYMRFVLPPVRVRPEFKERVRIAWCHNIGTNITEKATFKEDDDTYQTWDNIWADIYFQFYQSSGAGKKENHNIGIGNVACLESWSEFLPSYPINVDQPWFYSMDPALSFPIFYKNTQTRAEHRYSFRRKISDLLRVQIFTKEGVWKDTTRRINKYLDIDPASCIKMPELWGRYSYITEGEIKWHKCEPEKVFYTRDIVACDTENAITYKNTSEVTLDSTNPCLAFFWVAENKDAKAVKNYSNYTTDTQDLYLGWDPIKTTTLKYGAVTRFSNMPSDHFSIAEPRKHFPSSPQERGYHGYSYAANSSNFDCDVAILLSKMGAKLSCLIDNNDIYISTNYDDEEEDEDEDNIMDSVNDKDDSFSDKKRDTKSVVSSVEGPSPNFVTRVRLLITRKFVIKTGKDGDYMFTIE